MTVFGKGCCKVILSFEESDSYISKEINYLDMEQLLDVM